MSSLPIAYLAEGWARLTGGTPRTTVDGVRLSRKRMYFSSARAESELGYRSRGGRAAIRDAADWFRTNGYLALGGRDECHQRQLKTDPWI